MQIDEARTLLNLPDTFTPQLLKSAYRRAALCSHPDKGGNNALFQQLSTAYAILLPLSRQDSKLAETKTDDGTKLSELGKGYPLSESARECPECHGAGYLKHGIGTYHQNTYKMGFVTCRKCLGVGEVKMRNAVIPRGLLVNTTL
jgi:DnaJ-class molecular chaperone